MPTLDEERFNALYHATRDAIVAYVIRRTASREDAADVVAETYATAWRRMDVVPDGHAGLLWLYVTARHLLANAGRKQRHQDDVIGRIAADLNDLGLVEEPHDEDGLVALFCLNSLPEEQREILMLAGWEGLSATEIGRVLDCSPTAARIRLHRARVRLRNDMSEFSAETKRVHSPQHEEDRDVALDSVPEEA